jgi:hypothetical protein
MTNTAQVAEDPASIQGGSPCPYCGGALRAGARKCKHCHEYIDDQEEVLLILSILMGEDVEPSGTGWRLPVHGSGKQDRLSRGESRLYWRSRPIPTTSGLSPRERSHPGSMARSRLVPRPCRSNPARSHRGRP